MDVIRIGQVTDVNTADGTVRVHFPDVDIVSGWLKVIKSPPFIPQSKVEQRTENESGGSGEESFASHSHKVIISPWMPEIGETVLCIYGDEWNGDGYVLGAL